MGILPRRMSEQLQQCQPLLISSPKKQLLKDCGSTRISDADSRRLLGIGGGARWFANFVRAVAMLCALLLLASFALVYGSGALLMRANELGRQCGVQLQRQSHPAPPILPLKLAMVSCSDGSSSVPRRSFEGLMELAAPNKQAYVLRHGYAFIDASDCLDRHRPPSWSKILAVRKHLPNYDWVFWNDADSVVTNPAIALEDIIKSVVGDAEQRNMPDFIVTEDVTGVNAGMFFFRNSEWSHRFLQTWWNQTAFIRPFGQCKSGDNDALKFLIKTMDPGERDAHVRVAPMQCLFNSNLWVPSWKNGRRLITWTSSIWRGAYSRGDFMVHLAGMGNKKALIEKLLGELDEQQSSSSRRAGPP